MATSLKAERGVNTYSGPSFSDLPKEISVNILARLSIKRIFVCKCMCKTWCDIISGSEFANFHLKQAEFCPLIRISNTKDSTLVSRSLYLLQSERDDFEARLDMCGLSDSQVYVNLNTKFELPLRNFENIAADRAERNNFIKLRGCVHDYNIVNSCNGLLCLSNDFYNNPSVICNPTTGEFINLPDSTHTVQTLTLSGGFGFSCATNQYKVMRTFINKQDANAGNNNYVLFAEVHTLGTESWRKVCSFSELRDSRSTISFPSYVNGRVYWYSSKVPPSIISFDIEEEQFGSVSIPTPEGSDLCNNTRIGVLGGELCISRTSSQSVGFWVMKDDSGNFWSKILSIVLPSGWGCYYNGIIPIKYLSDGSLLLFNFGNRALMYEDPKSGRLIYLKAHGVREMTKVISHIPSFVSLKDFLTGLDVKVLNVKSRCAKLKLLGDPKCVSLVEWTPRNKLHKQS